MDGRYDSRGTAAVTPVGKANDAEGTWESNQPRHNGGGWSDDRHHPGSESVSDTDGDSLSEDGERGDEHRPLSNHAMSSRSVGTGANDVSSVYGMDGSTTGTFLGDGDTTHCDSSGEDGSGDHGHRDRRSSTHVHTSSSSNASTLSAGDHDHTDDDGFDEEEDHERRTFAEIMDMVSSMDGDDDEDVRHRRAHESSPSPHHDDANGDGDDRDREREGERTVSFGGASDADIDDEGGGGDDDDSGRRRRGLGDASPANSGRAMGDPDGGGWIADESGGRGSVSSGGLGEELQPEEDYHGGAAPSSSLRPHVVGRAIDDQEEEYKISIDREGTRESAGYGHNGDQQHDRDWDGHQQQEQSRMASAGEPPRHRDAAVDDEEEQARKTVLSDVNLLTKHLESQRSVAKSDDASGAYEPFPAIPRQNNGFPRTYCFGLIKDRCDVAIAAGVVFSVVAFVTAVLVIELVL